MVIPNFSLFILLLMYYGVLSSAQNPDAPAVEAVLPQGAPASTPLSDSEAVMNFYMHDILGGSNPSARAVTGIVDDPRAKAQIPFAKRNGMVLTVNNGVRISNDGDGLLSENTPFFTGLGGIASNVFSNDGNGNKIRIPVGSTVEKLMFGTVTVFDDELTQGPELGSGKVGKAQGFYVASSQDGRSQVIALTAMFESDNYADTLCFFGVQRLGVSESQLAIMGGTGKFVNAKGFAITKTLPPRANQLETGVDGVDTIVEFTVYPSY